LDPHPAREAHLFHFELGELRLLHLADSALPIGSLAHSFGLETLVAAEILKPEGLPDFFHAYLQEAGMVEAVFCREAFRLSAMDAQKFSRGGWVQINQRLDALKPARESRAGSAALGRNFLNAVVALGDFPVLREAFETSRQSGGLVHHSPAFGLAAGALSFDEDRAALAFLHQLLANLISACQRLLPLGQSEATRILWNLKPAMVGIVARSARSMLDDACCFTPLLDWGAMAHPALSTRLFIS
jgi:urease accessory protein